MIRLFGFFWKWQLKGFVRYLRLRGILGQPVVIKGCIDPSPLLFRYPLLRTPYGDLFLHHFRRSDEDRELHDHPWSFFTLILAGGYLEQLPLAIERRYLLDRAAHPEEVDQILRARAAAEEPILRTEWRFRAPGTVHYRPATWVHRVELLGCDAWTLIWVTKKNRFWGFWTRDGWVLNEKYSAAKGCAPELAAAMAEPTPAPAASRPSLFPIVVGKIPVQEVPARAPRGEVRT